MGTAVMYAFEYLMGFPFFGLVYWIMNGILVDLRSISVQDTVFQYGNYIWAACVVIYIVFGIFYFIRRLKTWTIEK